MFLLRECPVPAFHRNVLRTWNALSVSKPRLILEGKLQQTKGNITHSDADKVKGAAKVIEGKAEEKYGQAKDAVRKATE